MEPRNNARAWVIKPSGLSEIRAKALCEYLAQIPASTVQNLTILLFNFPPFSLALAKSTSDFVSKNVKGRVRFENANATLFLAVQR